jgi:hypothetical protein
MGEEYLRFFAQGLQLKAFRISQLKAFINQFAF